MPPKLEQKFNQSHLTVPPFLLVLCVLAYGLSIPSLGYYWDVWLYAYINHMFGPGGYPELVASDRPFSAWIFMGLAALWGEELVGCHINSVFCIGCVHYFLIIHVNLIAGDGFKGN